MKKFPSLSISAQLAVLMIGAVTLSLLLTSAALIRVSFQSSNSLLESAELAKAQLVSEKINAYFDDLQRKISYLARVRGLTAFNAADQRYILEGLIYHNSAYQEVGITDNQGRLLQGISRTDIVIPENWGDTAVFRGAFQEQEDYFGLVELGAPGEYPTLILAAPIRDAQNEVDGMLFARINLKFLWAILDEVKIGENGYVYILNQRGLVVAQSGGVPEDFTLEVIPQSPLEQLLANPERAPQAYRGLRGEMVLGNISKITSANWHVVVELPTTEVYAPLYNLISIMGMGLILAIVLAGFAGVSLAKYVTQPIEQLTDAAARLSLGNLETRVLINGDNELNLMANTFNLMAARLQSTITQLEEDIVERKRAQEALRLSENRLSLATRAGNIGVWDWDIANDKLVWEDNMYSLYGIRKEDFGNVYDAWLKTLHPDDRDYTDVEVQAALRGEREYAPEFRIIRRDGEIRVMKSASQTLYDENGKARRMIGVNIDITERKQAEEKVKDSLLEKETLLKEIHHRVKNNLQVISSLLYLQSRTITDENTQTLFLESRNRIASMSLIHEKLYQSTDFAHISFTSYARDLAKSIFESHGIYHSRVSLSMEANDLTLDINSATPCGLIINEILSNSLKYAFPNQQTGNIRIELTLEPDDRFNLTLSDDGVGLPADFEIRSAKSLGTKLIQRLAQQMNGTIERSSSSQGTRYVITFPREA